MKSLEVIVRANITVKSSIKNLLLRDASTVVSCGRGHVGVGKLFFPSAPVPVPLTLHSPDSRDGLPGPCGCGGRRSPLVGHPPGRPGRVAGAGAVGAAHVEGEAWGWGCWAPLAGCRPFMLRFSVPPALSFLWPTCAKHLYVPGTLLGSG